ncbi:hypothetical protein J7M28_00460, partial [bacterium]|nr:hypothetical protein [bacterium]
FSRARYYNQSLGRFFSRDPIMGLGSLYRYCSNSPENFTDPTGTAATGLNFGASALTAQAAVSGGVSLGMVCPGRGSRFWWPGMPCSGTVEKNKLANGDTEYVYKDDDGNEVRREVHHTDGSVDVYNRNEDGSWSHEDHYDATELNKLGDRVDGLIDSITDTALSVFGYFKTAYDGLEEAGKGSGNMKPTGGGGGGGWNPKGGGMDPGDSNLPSY